MYSDQYLTLSQSVSAREQSYAFSVSNSWSFSVSSQLLTGSHVRIGSGLFSVRRQRWLVPLHKAPCAPSRWASDCYAKPKSKAVSGENQGTSRALRKLRLCSGSSAVELRKLECATATLGPVRGASITITCLYDFGRGRSNENTLLYSPLPASHCKSRMPIPQSTRSFPLTT